MSGQFALIIPVRLSSQRLSEKIFSDIGGKTLLQRVLDKTHQIQNKHQNLKIAFAIDDIKTATHLKEHDNDCVFIMTPKECLSGTDRVFAASKDLKGEYKAIINLQGDMPFFDTSLIDQCLGFFNSNPNFEGIWTAGHEFEKKEEFESLSQVKALLNAKSEAIYFSRLPIPFSRTDFDPKTKSVLCHIGIYAFTPKSISTFCSLEKSPIEEAEKLEQLRAIDNGIQVFVQKVDPAQKPNSYRGIDTQKDLEWANEFS